MIEIVKQIKLTVTERMRLWASKPLIVNDGDINSVEFAVVQPEKMDNFICRAEIGMGRERTFTPVTQNRFILPPAVAGRSDIQLVYTTADGETVAKTEVLTLNVSRSVNAISASNGDSRDGLAQLRAEGIASAAYEDNILSFYNYEGEQKFSAELTGRTDYAASSEDVAAMLETLS